MKKITFPFLWLALCSMAQAQSYTSYFAGNANDVITSPLGGICMMGGASESDEAMQWFLQRANGGDVLVLRASGSNGYNNYMYSQLGVNINSVESIVFHNASAAFDPYIHQRIQRAEAIWFAGGDQWNYVSYWRNTPIESLINIAIQERNIVIGGTSAGMAILGGFYFTAQNGTVTSANALANPYNDRMTVDSARFLQNYHFRDVITDTHYDNPNRKGRHTAFLARIFTDWGIEAKGIACDEYTAVCVDPEGNARVFGGFPAFDDNAYFIQVNCELSERHPETCSPGTPLHWHRDGQALKVYKVKGTTTGNNRFSLVDWQTGSGGVWENWDVSNGTLFDSPGDPVLCPTVDTENLAGADAALSLYPNPGTHRLTVEFAGIIQAVTVLDLVGRVLYSARHPGETGRFNMDTAGWASGMYIIRVQTLAGAFSRKWVKQ